MKQPGIIIICLMLALSLLLSGCTPLPFVRNQEPQQVQLPVPPDENAPKAPMGDGRTDESQSIALYYLSSDQGQLTPVQRTFWLAGDEDLIEKAMELLLTPPQRDDARAIAPPRTRLLSSECSGDVITLDLSSEALSLTEQERVYMTAAITNTLTRLSGAHFVNVLISGQAQESASSLPSGALQSSDASLTSLWAQFQVDQQRFSPNYSPRQLDTYAVLYFAASQSERLLPEVRKVRFTSDDLILPLLREMVRGPSDLPEASAVLPGDLEPMMSQPTISTSTSGKRLITLPFNPEFMDEIVRRGVSMRQFYGALTLTLCRFVPEVDGIVVRAGGERVERVEGAAGVQLFPDGVMSPADFEAMLGDVANIYLGSGKGLKRVGRVLDTYSARSPRALLEQLLLGPAEHEEGLLPVMPEGVSSADLLGVWIEGDMALLNLSSNFYRCCQQLSEDEERRLVYAIVNTLTELAGLNRVRFYVDGELTDTLAREIYVRGELIRNPGLIVSDEDNAGA